MWSKTMLEMIGNEVRILCRSSGSPEPIVSWIDPDGHPIIQSPEKHVVTSDGDLLIKGLTWSDMGAYTCLASNSKGNDRSSTFLYPTAVE